MTGNNPEALFRQVSVFIDESNRLLKEGEFVQLKGLDEQVDAMCREVLKLSGEQRAQYAEKLQQIIVSLQQLGENLTAAREVVGKQMGELSSHRKANVAYQKAESSDRKKKQDT